MAPRWPDPLSNVQSPRPRPLAHAAPHGAGHAPVDRPAGIFQCDVGARVGAHRIGVHTEPYTSAPLGNHLNRDGIWPAMRGPQDRRTPGYDPAELPACGTEQDARPYRDQYMAADYRTLRFEPRLNAATAARSEHGDYAAPAGAVGIRGRARRLTWQDEQGGAAPHGHPCLYPASSLYPASERLQGALEWSLDDARDERAMRGAPAPSHGSSAYAAGAYVARADAHWDASAADRLCGALDASCSAALAVDAVEAGTPRRVGGASVGDVRSGRRLLDLGGGAVWVQHKELDERVAHAREAFAATLEGLGAGCGASIYARSTGYASGYENSGAPPPRPTAAWVDMTHTATPAHTWPILAAEPALYADYYGEEAEEEGWGVGSVGHYGDRALTVLHSIHMLSISGISSSNSISSSSSSSNSSDPFSTLRW